MTIEEKAKRYDEALIIAKQWYNDSCTNKKEKCLLKGMFPELKESEDERIREEMISWLKGFIGEEEGCGYTEDEIKERIAWLEKQKDHEDELERAYKCADEVQYRKGYEAAKREFEKQGVQKPKDKPKFKVGDWITNGACTIQITSVDDTYYWHDNDCVGGDIESMDKEYHFWTIQDAKDGDIFAWDDSKCIALFKNIYDENSFNSYGFVGHCTGTFESGLSYHDIEGAHPATKEQRDTLEKAMADAGYTFDFDKKELKKIEQKPAWSEEDENMLQKAISTIMYALSIPIDREDDPCFAGSSTIAWLKSIKERVQPKQEWSEEDEYVFSKVLDWMLIVNPTSSIFEKLPKEQFIERFKSIKERYTWKPSDEQMQFLWKYAEQNNYDGAVLTSLFHDLKKLREE